MWVVVVLLPALQAKTVGSPCTSSVCANDDSLSLFTLANRNIPPLFIAADSSMGPSCLQGPHQSAYTSTSTGTGDSNTIFWKFSEVTSNTQSSFFAGVGALSFTPADPVTVLPFALLGVVVVGVVSLTRFSEGRMESRMSRGTVVLVPRVLRWSIDHCAGVITGNESCEGLCRRGNKKYQVNINKKRVGCEVMEIRVYPLPSNACLATTSSHPFSNISCTAASNYMDMIREWWCCDVDGVREICAVSMCQVVN